MSVRKAMSSSTANRLAGLATRPLRAPVVHKGLACPAGTRFRDLLITGPPASGKSTLVEQLGGWPYEGTIDLAAEGWWRHRELTYRPREVHLAMPWGGRDESYTTFDDEVRGNLPELDLGRIRIPPTRTWLLGANWRSRYLLVFLVPHAEELFAARAERGLSGNHAVDEGVQLEEVIAEVNVYNAVAAHLGAAGLRICVSAGYGRPLQKVTGRAEA